MTRIVQITDAHLLEPNVTRRTGFERARVEWLSLGRPLDPADRRRRLADALHAARKLVPDHVVLTGDLTEDGVDAQFEALAEVLSESSIPAERITLIPGNHDGYHDIGAFDRALEGPLRRYLETSRTGVFLELGDLVLAVISTMIEQPFTRAAGAIHPRVVDGLRRLARSPFLEERALVVAQHHPPTTLMPGAQWFEGIAKTSMIRDLLCEAPHVHVIHGHTHRATDRAVMRDRAPQIFSAPSVAEASCEDAVRLYQTAPRLGYAGEAWFESRSEIAPSLSHPHADASAS